MSERLPIFELLFLLGFVDRLITSGFLYIILCCPIYNIFVEFLTLMHNFVLIKSMLYLLCEASYRVSCIYICLCTERLPLADYVVSYSLLFPSSVVYTLLTKHRVPTLVGNLENSQGNLI